MAAWRQSFMEGARLAAPIGLFVVPFGIAYGAAAIETGLAPWVALLKSALMFAGAAQIAALEIWHEPLPIVTLILLSLAVNARHILLGATLAPRLLHLPPVRLTASLYFLTDANWAALMGERGARVTNLPAYLVGSGVVLWITWMIGTWLGVEVGREIGDLKRYGLDLIMVIYFGAVVVGQWRGRVDLAPWLTAAGVGIAGSLFLPLGWHVITGALAGGLVGLWQAAPPEASEQRP